MKQFLKRSENALNLKTHFMKKILLFSLPWKKTLFSVFILLLSYAVAKAQTAHYYIDGGRNEIIKRIKTLPDGSSVLVGYIYDLSPAKEVINSDNIALRIRSNGTIMWQKQWGAGNPNDNDELHDVIITRDGNYAVCVGQNYGYNVNTSSTAAMYMLDINTGTIAGSHFCRDNAMTYAGDAYHGICELARKGNGDYCFLAVGGTNFQSGDADGLVSVVTFNGNITTAVYDYALPLDPNSTDWFTSVISDNNSPNNIYITGVIENDNVTTSLYDMTMVYISGADITPTTGKQYRYEFTMGMTGNAGFVTLRSNFSHNISQTDNVVKNEHKIMVVGAFMDDYGTPASTADRQFIFTFDKNGFISNNPNPTAKLWVVDNIGNGTLQSAFCNHSTLVPIDYNNIFITNNPAQNKFFHDVPGVATGLDIWASKITNLSTTPTVSNSIKFLFNDNEVVHNIAIAQGKNVGGYLAMAGNAEPAGRNDNDIYFGLINPALDGEGGGIPIHCSQNVTTEIKNKIFTPFDSIYVPSPLVPISPPAINEPNLTLSISLICGIALPKAASTDVNNAENIKSSLRIAPNPANGYFNTFYAIPTDFKKAEMVVTDVTGKIMVKSAPITEQIGTVRVDLPANMPQGVFLCTMYVDGKVSGTQTLVVQ